MSRKLPLMTPLELRKKLLIAESDLNRAQLAADMSTVTAGIRSLTDSAKSFGSIASSVMALMAALTALQRGKAGDAEAKPSWLKTILKGTGLISTFWMAFRSPGRDQKGK